MGLVSREAFIHVRVLPVELDRQEAGETGWGANGQARPIAPRYCLPAERKVFLVAGEGAYELISERIH